MTAEQAPAPERRLDIDHVRNAVVLSLIVFHTARLFDREAWHVKDAAAYAAADLIVAVLNVPSMPILFLLAGASSFFSLGRRSASDFLRERARRLLVPLVFGMLVIVPPQVLVERMSPGMALRMSPIDYAGGLSEYLPRMYDCCYPAANLSWHHLWFLAYLLFYALIAAPLFWWFASSTGRALVAAAGRAVTPGFRLFLPILPLGSIEMFLRPIFPSTHDLAHDWANHAHFGLLFVLGWWVAASANVEKALSRTRWIALGVAAAALAIWLSMPSGPGSRAVRVVAEWCSMIAILGFARLLLSRPLPFLTAFSRIALPFYIVHQTVIVLMGWATAAWSDAPLAKFAVVAALSFVLSLGLARMAARIAPLRFGLGIPGTVRS